MAAARERKPLINNKIEGFPETINAAVFIFKDESVITASDDRSVRVWIKRDTGRYWPSIDQNFIAPATCLDFDQASGRLFVGIGNGNVVEFVLSNDSNKLTEIRTYTAHTATVTGLVFSLKREWILSTGRDRIFTWHHTESGVRLGGHMAASWCTCLKFDEKAAYAFVGTYSGEILIIRLLDPVSRSNSSSSSSAAGAGASGQPYELVRVLHGHNGSVRSLTWDSDRGILYSGSFDAGINVWDVGGGKGAVYELNGHTGRVQSLSYCSPSRQLISAGDDGQIIFWQMDVKRDVTPEWRSSDTCEICGVPFFWNLKKLWADRKIAFSRQHHCRNCGKAICDKCSGNNSTIPQMGYELQQRVCKECFEKIKPEDRVPLAIMFPTQDPILAMHFHEKKWKLLTVGGDRTIKLWDVAPVMKP